MRRPSRSNSKSAQPMQGSLACPRFMAGRVQGSHPVSHVHMSFVTQVSVPLSAVLRSRWSCQAVSLTVEARCGFECQGGTQFLVPKFWFLRSSAVSNRLFSSTVIVGERASIQDRLSEIYVVGSGGPRKGPAWNRDANRSMSDGVGQAAFLRLRSRTRLLRSRPLASRFRMWLSFACDSSDPFSY